MNSSFPIRKRSTGRAICGGRHQNVVPYFLAGHDPVKRDTAIFEVVFALLVEAGVPKAQVITVSRSLVAFLTGYILAEVNALFTVENLRLRFDLAATTPDVYPTLLSLPPPPVSADDHFEGALELLIRDVKGLA